MRVLVTGAEGQLGHDLLDGVLALGALAELDFGEGAR